MNENLRELMTFGDVDLEEREKFEKKYREEQRVLQKLRSKKRFRKRQHEKAMMLELKDLAKKLKSYTQGKSLKDRLIKEESER